MASFKLTGLYNNYVPCTENIDEIMQKNFRIGVWHIMPDHNKLVLNGEDFVVEPLVMDVMIYFAKHPRKVLSRDELVEMVWKGRIVGDHAVYRIINQLRKILSQDPSNSYIETIRKKGYQLNQDVQWIDTPSSVDEQIILSDNNLNSSIDNKLTTHNELPITESVNFASDSELGSESKQQKQEINRTAETELPNAPEISFKNKRGLLLSLIAITVLFIFSYGHIERLFAYQLVTSFKAPLPFSVLIGEERDPQFSPDGQQIVFSHRGQPGEHFKLYQQALSGESPKQLTFSVGDDLSPSWSPDGSELVFIRHLDVGCQIMRLDLKSISNKERSKRILDCYDSGQMTEVKWATGDKLYFTNSNSDVDPQRLYRYHLKTGKLEQLTNPEVGKSKGDIHFVLSHNEKLIAFARDLDWGNTQIQLLNLETKLVKPLFYLSGWRKALAWSHDDSYLYNIDEDDNIRAYSIKHGFNKLVLENRDTVNALSSHRAQEKLAIMTGEMGIDIWGMGLDSQSTERSVIQSSEIDLFPEFSNLDKRQIAFMSLRSGQSQIWIRQTDGREYQISRFNDGRKVQRIRWSPDDRLILSSSGNLLYTIDTQSKNYQVLWQYKDNVRIEAPSWSRDGKSVYFSSDLSGDWQVYQLSLETNAPPWIVSSNGGYGAIESADGALYFFKYHQDGIWRLSPDRSNEYQCVDDTNVFAYDALYATEQGFIYIATGEQGNQLSQFDVATEKKSVLMRIDNPFLDVSISSDQTSVLFPKLFSRETEIKIVAK